MSRIDALPADQKSVLQLLLRQGKGYDDLSEMLHLDVGDVRSRAHDALDALGPGAGGLPAERRKAIADWLLGQQGPDEAAATRAFLDGSPAGRSWAQAVAGELKPLAGDRLPDIPANGVPRESAAAAFGATPIAPAPSAAPRVSRRGGAALIGGVLAVIAVAVVLVLVLSGGSDKKSEAKNAADTTSGATSTQSQPKVQAQVNLTAPQGAPARKAVAIVQIVEVDGTEAVNAVSQGLTPSNKSAFAIWVYSSPSHAKLIGGFNKKDKNGHLVYQGALPNDFDITGYSKILVTRETSGSPKQPGTVYLSGDIPRSSGG
jgi:sigma-70-like protein